MTQVRIPLGSATLERILQLAQGGDEVLLEEHGKVVARVQGEPPPKRVDWEEFFRRRAEQPPLDDKFEEDIRQIVSERAPAEDIDWEPW